MRSRRWLPGVAAAIVLCSSSPGAGRSLRVSGEGPFRTLSAALEAAESGDTVEVVGGVHPAPVVVEKSVSLVGREWPVIDGGGSGTAVRLTAPGIHFSGFHVRGSGTSLDQEDSGIAAAAPNARIEGNRLEDVLFGIDLRNASGSRVRGNHVEGKDLPVPRRGDAVRLWSSNDVELEDNVVERARDVVVWYSERVAIRGNRITDGRYALHFMYTDDAVVEGNSLFGNSVGSYLMYSRRVRLRHNHIRGSRGPSGYGIGLKDMDDAVLEENLLAENRVGIYLDNSPRQIDATTRITGNVFAENDVGVEMQPALRRNHFAGNSFVGNTEQVRVSGAGTLEGNVWSGDGRGNYWSDYAGYDADGDGIGDLPYRAERLFEQLAERSPAVRLFLFSPAASAIDLAARAFPVIRPSPKLEDARPLMAPVVPEGLPVPRSRPGLPFAATAAGLVGFAGGLSFLSRLPASGAARAGSVRAAGAVAVEAQGVTRRFGRLAAVDALSFEVRPGEAVALWGRNGAGKTTLLRCVLGILRFEGTVRVGGLDVARHGKECRRLIGFVPQEIAFHDDLTVAETAHFYASLRGVALSGATPHLRRFGLDGESARPVRELSGGKKRLLALSLALLGDPPLLILDEPLSNLDATTREEFLRLLGGLKAAGKTLLFTTHRRSELLRLADRVIVLENGANVADGAPEEVVPGLAARLHLHVALAPDVLPQALAVLHRRGVAASQNGRGILVPVLPGRKAQPIAVLVDEGFSVEDFDLEPGEDA